MNGTPEHDRLRRLVLAWEELDERERAEAEAHLASCSACAALRAAFERHERSPGPRGELPATVFATPPGLPAGDDAAELESRARLLARLGAQAPGPERATSRPAIAGRIRWRRWAYGLAPVAAAAAILVWLGQPRPLSPPVIEELSALRTDVVRGEGGSPDDSLWRSGESFELRLRLARGGWPAVVLVDPRGEATLLRPAEQDTVRLGAGVQRLAPADPAQEWVLEGPAGRELLLVAVRETAPADRGALVRDLGAIDRRLAPAERLEAVRRVLERRVGAVRLVAIPHR